MEQLIDEFITKHVFPQFREVEPINLNGRYFSIGLNDNERVAAMSHFDNDLLISPTKWGIVQGMFSLTEDETVNVLESWFSKNVPLLSFARISLLRYP
jgi:hypothetical protein